MLDRSYWRLMGRHGHPGVRKTLAEGSGELFVVSRLQVRGKETYLDRLVAFGDAWRGKATVAPFLSMRAFVATVVPCTRNAMSSAETTDSWIDEMNASSGSRGVDKTLGEEIEPSATSKRIRSENVPPVSMPMRFDAINTFLR